MVKTTIFGNFEYMATQLKTTNEELMEYVCNTLHTTAKLKERGLVLKDSFKRKQIVNVIKMFMVDNKNLYICDAHNSLVCNEDVLLNNESFEEANLFE